jgi:hypothetical protein
VVVTDVIIVKAKVMAGYAGRALGELGYVEWRR